MGARRARGLRDRQREMERSGIEHRELAVEEIDELGAVLHIRRHHAQPRGRIDARERVGRTVRERHPIVAGRTEQPRHGGADLASADDDDVLHAVLCEWRIASSE